MHEGTGHGISRPISPWEAADRLAVRELADAYARCAQRRGPRGHMGLFIAGNRFLVFVDLHSAEPAQERPSTRYRTVIVRSERIEQRIYATRS